MKTKEIWNLIQRSQFVELGFVDSQGMPHIRKTYIQQDYKSISRHFISTNTSSFHVQELLKNGKACLYYSDDKTFEGLCFYGTIKVHFEKEYKAYFWHEGDEKYYPKGIEDEDYCILEFCSEYGQYYGNMGKCRIDVTQIDEKELGIEEICFK